MIMKMTRYCLYMMLLFLICPPPSLPDCGCHNPFNNTEQPHLGDPGRRCRTTGVCFVPCTSTCSDSQRAGGFTGAGRCVSALACSLKGGTTTLAPIVVDLEGRDINQECRGSFCRQTNIINIEVEKNCGFSNCIQDAGKK